MKNISIYIAAMSLMGIFSSSCTKNLLNTIPDDRVSSEIFWKSDEDAIKSVNAIYPYLHGTQIFSWDALTEISHANSFFSTEGNIEQDIYDASNAKMMDEWTNDYTGIERSNYFLANVDRIHSTDTALISRLKAEARTLRAYQYIILASFFGGVPLVTTPLDISEAKQLKRTPVSDIWDFIDNELSASVMNLPLSYSQSDVGRITKGAALALKARADLFAGRYEEAAEAAKAVMDLHVYSIFPQYSKLFSYAGEDNPEIILDKQRLASVASNNVFNLMAPYSQKNSTNSYVPTKKMIDTYEMKNGIDIQDAHSGFDPYHPYLNRDPRLKYSVYAPGDTLPDGKIFQSAPNSGTPDAVGNTMHATVTGFTVKKYINKEDYADPSNNGINIILLRYAEVLLTYAEAKIELNQIDQSVYDAINEVRQRPDVDMPSIATNQTQTTFREILRRERTVELAFEGLHLFDIRRWTTAEKVVPGPVYGITYEDGNKLDTVKVSAFTKAFNPKRDYLWPIPYDEITLAPSLAQNPGW